MEAFQIGKVALKTGLSVDAIRFYEKEGLLPRPARTQSGYRLYQQREIADLEFIRKAQRLGFTLTEIRELLAIQREPVEACAHVQDMIVRKVAVVRGKIEELQMLETRLDKALQECRKAVRAPGKRRNACPVLQ